MKNETVATRRIMKRYNTEVGIAMATYSVLLVGALVLAEQQQSTPVKVLLALVPVVPLVFVVLSAIRAYRQSDEFMQRVLAEAGAVAFAVMLIGAAAVGMLGVLVELPGVAGFFVFALGMMAYLLASALLMRRRA